MANHVWVKEGGTKNLRWIIAHHKQKTKVTQYRCAQCGHLKWVYAGGRVVTITSKECRADKLVDAMINRINGKRKAPENVSRSR